MTINFLRNIDYDLFDPELHHMRYRKILYKFIFKYIAEDIANSMLIIEMCLNNRIPN